MNFYINNLDGSQVINKPENLVKLVAEHRAPRFIKIGNIIYEAEFDDFCCFCGYGEIKIADFNKQTNPCLDVPISSDDLGPGEFRKRC